jgi:hypothetical protein
MKNNDNAGDAVPNRINVLGGAILILFVAALTISIFMGLQIAKLPFGLEVLPSGEDYTWLDILGRPNAASQAYAFWTDDWRNPLNPWWHIAVQKLYAGTPNGPLLTRLLIGPFVGLTAYFAVLAVTEGRAGALALCSGLLSVVWTFNTYVDQIYWNFLGAAAVSLGAVACYAVWISRARTSALLYGSSTVLWFIAFATYAFQTGAILAMAMLSVLRPQASSSGWFGRIGKTTAELLPLAAMLMLFHLVWITTRHPTMSAMLRFDISAFAERILESLWYGIWPGNYFVYFAPAWSALGWILPVVAGGAGITVAAGSFLLVRRAPAVLARDAMLVLTVALLLALPTMLIEATSPVWTVGTRWRMLDQAIKPMLWLSLLALALAALPWRAARQLCLATTTGFLAAALLTLSLGHNRIQNHHSAEERALQQGVTAVVSRTSDPVAVIVLLEPGVREAISDTLSPAVARVWFPGRTVGLRILQPEVPGSNPLTAPGRLVELLPHKAVNTEVAGGDASYQHLHILRFDGRSVTRPAQIDASDVVGYPITWKRDGPLVPP